MKKKPSVLSASAMDQIAQAFAQGKIPSVPSPSKYKNKKTEVDGVIFHSKREAKRYGELKLLEGQGKIKELVLQPPYPCKVNGHVVTTYVADFRYYDVCSGRVVVEDSKGFRTPEYKLKKKLVEALYGIQIVEV